MPVSDLTLPIQQTKLEQRRILRQQRLCIPVSKRKQATKRCNRYLFRIIRRRKHIGVYWAMGSELSLYEFITVAQRRGAFIYLPYIMPEQKRLWFSLCPHINTKKLNQIDSKRQYNKFNKSNAVSKSSIKPKIRAHQLHTLVLPLIGINYQGIRLGQGGGFYDVTLANNRHRLSPSLIGTGFACQQIRDLAHESHDYSVHAFVCETGWQWFR